MHPAEYNDLLDSLSQVAPSLASMLPDTSPEAIAAAAAAFNEECQRQRACQAAEDAMLHALMEQVDSRRLPPRIMEER